MPTTKVKAINKALQTCRAALLQLWKSVPFPEKECYCSAVQLRQLLASAGLYIGSEDLLAILKGINMALKKRRFNQVMYYRLSEYDSANTHTVSAQSLQEVDTQTFDALLLENLKKALLKRNSKIQNE